jgi:hypothetical protein
MNTKMNRVLVATAAVLLSSATAALAQTPPPTKNIFVDVNYGVQPSSRTISTSAFPVVYGEVAIINANQEIDGASMLDVMAGYRVWRDLSVALGLTTTFTTEGTAEVTGGIPHPLFFDTRRESRETVSDLAHREQSAHVSVMWTSPVTDKVDASGFFGPSYVKVYQDLVTDVTVPAGTQSFIPNSSEQTDTVWGFHLGGELTYLITPRIGIGGMARFVKAKADLPSVEDLDLGGIQIGGGLRVRF